MTASPAECVRIDEVGMYHPDIESDVCGVGFAAATEKTSSLDIARPSCA